MSPACYRHFSLLRDTPQIRGATDEVTRAARLIFEAIMSAPAVPAEPRSASGTKEDPQWNT